MVQGYYNNRMKATDLKKDVWIPATLIKYISPEEKADEKKHILTELH
jgi:hypothetical protein